MCDTKKKRKKEEKKNVIHMPADLLLILIIFDPGKCPTVNRDHETFTGLRTSCGPTLILKADFKNHAKRKFTESLKIIENQDKQRKTKKK